VHGDTDLRHRLIFLYTKTILVYQIAYEDRVDEPKRLANLDKNGFDLADVVHFEWEAALITMTYTKRFKAVGRYDDGTAVVIYAELGTEAISIVSFRSANARERKLI
jgi:uncharacterized DUF497 family protein